MTSRAVTATVCRTLDHLVARALREEVGDDAFGWCIHHPLDGRPHVLVTPEPGELWRTMLGQAVRAAIAQRVGWYATALRKAGLGVATWGHTDQAEALIAAATQAEAEVRA